METKIEICQRYIDGVPIMSESKVNVLILFNLTNTMRTKIKFRIEHEEFNQLPFLDSLAPRTTYRTDDAAKTGDERFAPKWPSLKIEQIGYNFWIC